MPLPRILIVDEAHSDNVLNRKDPLGTIGVVIHESEHSDIAGHVGAEDTHVIVGQLVS